MRYKVTFLTGLAAGYVLGARAGRSRYEQIARSYSQFMGKPEVQQVKDSITEQATDALAAVKTKVADKVHHKAEPVGATTYNGASGPSLVDPYPN